MLSWEDLIDRLRRRDPTAQVDVYETYRDPLYFILLKVLPVETIHHSDCVENGITAAFMEFFERPDIFDPARSQSRDPLLTLLVGMARRRTLDCFRTLGRDMLAHKKLRSLDTDVLAESVGAADQGGGIALGDGDSVNMALVSVSNPSAVTDAIDALINGQISADEFYRRVLIHVDFSTLDELVGRLKPGQFVAWFLKYFVRLSVREIAQILKQTEHAVEGLLKRARKTLSGKDE